MTTGLEFLDRAPVPDPIIGVIADLFMQHGLPQPFISRTGLGYTIVNRGSTSVYKWSVRLDLDGPIALLLVGAFGSTVEVFEVADPSTLSHIIESAKRFIESKP